ncbi:hypothetical protein F4778DRAFT_719709 [Xylariomycetidae sp. FL2044]|nr:hypothetical protein F4778DRAFT_719709 [Xylariomycetidae sp. FL2044]
MSKDPLMRVALGLGLIPAALGINALLRPESALTLFKVPLPSDPQALKPLHALARIYGIRNIVFSGFISLIFSRDDRGLMGWAFLFATSIASVDGLAARGMTGGEGQWDHFGGVPIFLGIASRLLGWF